MALAWLLFLFAVSTLGEGKVFTPCELAESLVKQHGFKANAVGSWVCLAKFSSGFNTMAVDGPFSDGTYSYGIFQINEKYCRAGKKSECGVTCSALHNNDIASNAQCALKIFLKQGFAAWPAWTNDCKGKDVGQYVKRCSLKARAEEFQIESEDEDEQQMLEDLPTE